VNKKFLFAKYLVWQPSVPDIFLRPSASTCIINIIIHFFYVLRNLAVHLACCKSEGLTCYRMQGKRCWFEDSSGR